MQYFYSALGLVIFTLISYMLAKYLEKIGVLGNYNRESLWQMTAQKTTAEKLLLDKNNKILSELGIRVHPNDLISLIQNEERLKIAQKKLKLKAFW